MPLKVILKKQSNEKKYYCFSYLVGKTKLELYLVECYKLISFALSFCTDSANQIKTKISQETKECKPNQRLDISKIDKTICSNSANQTKQYKKSILPQNISVQTGQDTPKDISFLIWDSPFKLVVTRQVSKNSPLHLVVINYWNTKSETGKVKNLPLDRKMGNTLSCSCDHSDMAYGSRGNNHRQG